MCKKFLKPFKCFRYSLGMFYTGWQQTYPLPAIFLCSEGIAQFLLLCLVRTVQLGTPQGRSAEYPALRQQTEKHSYF